MMHCPNCNTPADVDATFCGLCGQPLAPNYLSESIGAGDPRLIQAEGGWQSGSMHGAIAPDAFMMGYPRTPSPSMGGVVTPGFESPPQISQPMPQLPQLSRPISRSMVPVGSVYTSQVPLVKRPSRQTGRNLIFIGIILALLGVGIAAGLLAVWQNKRIYSERTSNAPVSLVGKVTFSDSRVNPDHTDNLVIQVNGLKNPSSDQHYVAWMVNEQNETITSLGTLEKNGSHYSLIFAKDGQNLLTLGNKLQITQESTNATYPEGRVVLNGHFPPLAFNQIKHLLTSSPETPNHTALVVGLRDQARDLFVQSQPLSTANNRDQIRCLAQNMVNLIEGKNAHQEAPSDCGAKQVTVTKGDGFGLLGDNNNGYVSNVALQASLAATQSDATETISTHAKQIITATDNLKNWYTTIDQDAHVILKNPDDTTKIREMVSLADQALNGTDQNNDGQVDPVHGEAGANDAYLYAQDMAELTLTA